MAGSGPQHSREPYGVKLPPGHSMNVMLQGTRINVPATLDLDDASHIEVLRSCAPPDTPVGHLVHDWLNPYLAIFPERHWRTVHDTGAIMVPLTPTHSRVYALSYLLEVTRDLTALSHYPNFAALLTGFRNPTQVEATLFEVASALWCHGRELTVSLEFAPTVTRKGHVKRPEFIWKTEFGSMWCECKQANEYETKYHVAFERLFSALEAAHARYQWTTDLRLDVWVRHAGPRLPELLSDLVDTAFRYQRLGRVPWDSDHRLAAVFRPLGENPPPIQDTLVGARTQVTDVERHLRMGDSPYFFALDVSRSRKAAATHLLKEARGQLPEDGPNAIFLSFARRLAVHEKVQQLFEEPSYRPVRFVSVVDQDGLASVTTRRGQPFDLRLLHPRASGLGPAVLRCVRRPLRRAAAWCLPRA